MNDYKDIIKLAIDNYKGKVEKYSAREAQDVLWKALVEINGGSTKLNYKNIRDGKCNGLFTIIETILSSTIVEGLTENDFFNAFVDYRNLQEGDSETFVTEDSNLFVVSKVADGTQGVRRQRLGGYSETTIPTEMHMVRIYEELNRVLSGKVDFNQFIDTVAKSFSKNVLDEIYALWNGATAADLGGAAYFPVAGTYSEDALLELIAHVEASSGGKTATILGTKKACRKLAASIQSDGAKDELHNLGYYGKFYGTPVVVTPQRHKLNSTEFVFDDNVLTIIAGDDKPIKFIYEGESIVLLGEAAANADLTQEYLYGEKYGLGIVLAGGNAGIGKYKTT